MSSKHDPRASLFDIVENAQRLARHIDGHEQASLLTNQMLLDAVERCIERVCEAVYRLDDTAELLMPGQPWAEIRGTGNRLRHAYDTTDVGVIWTIATVSLPALMHAA